MVLAVLLLSSGCGRSELTEDFLQSYQVRAGTVVEIYNPNGEVKIRGWDEDRVEIAAVKKTYRGQSALDEVDIFIDIAEIMVIETDHPEGAKKVSVSYDIKIPENVLVGVVQCSNGGISLEAVNGDPVVSTSNGNIRIKEVQGVVSVRSSNGSIEASNVQGLASILTSNGNISADLSGLKDDLEIRTSNGSIRLYIDPELAVVLDASTSNGEITFSNLNIVASVMEQTALAGEMNGGGHLVSLTTSNGSIELLRLR